MRDDWTASEQVNQTDVRWWGNDEIAASDAWFAPRRMAALLPGDHRRALSVDADRRR